MAKVTTTAVHLLSVPLEKDYKQTLHFDSLAAQQDYFAARIKHSSTDFTYQRENEVIRYGAHIDDIRDCNYVMYQNPAYDSKWFYAFITEMEYKNDELTLIHIETDVMQTWLRGIGHVLHHCFVEREHVSSDTAGEHTYPENLETGPYKVQQRNANETLLKTGLIIGTTIDFNDPDFKLFKTHEIKEFNKTSGGVYNGIFSGVKYFMVSDSEARDLLQSVANTGQSDAIVSIFECPSLLVNAEVPSGKKYKEVKTGTKIEYEAWNSGLVDNEEENYKPTTLDGYTPRNKKLLTYPYCYMLMSNNSGGSAIYRYEDFLYNKCQFRIYSAVTPGMSIRIMPLDYNGATKNYDEGLTLGKFPVGSWANDVYTNWLTQNSVNNTVSVVTGLAMAVVGAASIAAAVPTGGGSIAGGGAAMGAIAGAGGVVGGVASVGSAVGQIYQHSFQPPQAAGNTNSGDATYSSGHLTFTAHQMVIKKEYARIIDEFFDMYGYKVCRVKTPNINHRQRYWYIKTIDANVNVNTGSKGIPQNQLTKIKECYNNGITFWKDTENFGSYTAANPIV